MESQVDDGPQNLDPFDQAKIALYKQLVTKHADILDLAPFLAVQQPDPDHISLTYTISYGENGQHSETLSEQDTLICKITAEIRACVGYITKETVFGTITEQRIRTLYFNEQSVFEALAAIDFSNHTTFAKGTRQALQGRWEDYLARSGQLDLAPHFNQVFDEFEFRLEHSLTLD